MNEQIQRWIENSLREFFLNDTSLIDRGLKEECINHRLAYYLEIYRPVEFNRYFVDVEYDKNGNDPKIIAGLNRSIRPDILIHRREEDILDNLIAFECKKLLLNEGDRIKLLGLLGNGFNYQLCLGISYQPNSPHFFLYERESDFVVPRSIDKGVAVGSLARRPQ